MCNPRVIDINLHQPEKDAAAFFLGGGGGSKVVGSTLFEERMTCAQFHGSVHHQILRL